ncbi:phosphodiester glycosidase family protein [Actinoplanes sp. NPDC051861]|uniref:phosphodiester glycosidase family protein n=1 Tax=Actinoplanes sp. NPDC051861 TaxID=3155170 RepID=UPI0034388525
MAYVGIDADGTRELSRALYDAAGQADEVRHTVLTALGMADVSSQSAFLLGDVQDRLSKLGAGLGGKADQVDQQVFAAQPITLAAASSPALQLPATDADTDGFLAEIRSRLAENPFDPIRFTDGNVTGIILKNPEGFPVLRESGGTLTGAAAAKDTPAFEVVIDGELLAFEIPVLGKILGGIQYNVTGDISPMLVDVEGLVIQDGKTIVGESSPLTNHLVVKPDPDGSGATWRLGAGDPPLDSALAFGGGIPILKDGLPFGVGNVYRDDAPAGLPPTGPPGAGNEQFLVQRNNEGFASFEKLGRDVGKVVTGLGPDGTVIVLVQPHGTDGPLMSELRDSLIRMGVRDAVAWDGSGSATLVVDGKVEIAPEEIRDHALLAGIGLRLPVSAEGLSNWVDGNPLYEGTELSFAPPAEQTDWMNDWWSPVPADGDFGTPELLDWSNLTGSFGGDLYDVGNSFQYYGGSPSMSAPMPETWDFGSLEGFGESTDYWSGLDFSGYDFAEYDAFDSYNFGMDSIDFGPVDAYTWE